MRTSWAVRAALALVVALSVWPFLWIVHSWPNSRDAVLWITKGVPSRHWGTWVFWEEHFNVGYRPVTALSYTVDWLVGGLRPEAYQLTDLALHAGCCALVFVAFLRLFPALPAWGGLVAAAVFALHPVSSIVVPHLARRGYPLATAFSLGGLLVLLPADRSVPRGPRLAGGLALLALGALSNEASYVVFPVAALLLAERARAGGFAALARAAAGPAVATGLLLAVRVAVIGELGGYHGDVDATQRALPIAVATWQGIVGLVPMRTGAPDPGAVALGVMAVVTLFYAIFAAIDLPRLLLGVWMVGLFAAYVPQGVWFPREVYMALPPLALLFAAVAADTWASRRPLAIRAALALPQVALLAALCWQSPVLLGPDPLQEAAWTRTDAVIDDLDRALAPLPKRAMVDAVIPYFERPEFDAMRNVESEESRVQGKQLFTWMSALHPTVRFGNTLLVIADPLVAGPVGAWSDGQLTLAADAGTFTSGASPRVEIRGASKILTPIPSGGYLYLHDGVSGRIAAEDPHNGPGTAPE